MIVLLTDFGHSEYVGVMKGVIYSVASAARVVDLCHTVSPQNIIEASWILKNNYEYFPPGATFCCVVDPGVGTRRKAIAVKTESYSFVGPDNGLLWETLKPRTVIDMREIPIPADASSTFHGRDVFAGAAAIIESGDFEAVGGKIDKIEKLELYRDGRKGMIVRIDRFGNVVTNLGKQGKQVYSVLIGRRRYRVRLHPNYCSAKAGELFLIEGSSGTLEISVRNGNANKRLSLTAGEKIEIS